MAWSPRWSRHPRPRCTRLACWPAERAQVLAGWNDTAAPVPQASVPELIAAQAARTPDAVAVISGDVHVSYGELDGAGGPAGAVAGQPGVGPETVVGLCLERGAELVTALLGVWHAGAAYLPLDPGYPPARRAFMLADSGAGVLVHRVAGLLDGGAGDDAVRADRLGRAAAGGGAVPAGAAAAGAGGICDLHVGFDRDGRRVWRSSHGGLANLAAAQIDRFAVAAGDRVLAFAAPGFDASVWEWWWRWARGRVLVAARAGQLLAGASWLGWWRGSGLPSDGAAGGAGRAGGWRAGDGAHLGGCAGRRWMVSWRAGGLAGGG